MTDKMEPSAIAEMMEKLLSQGKDEEARSIKCWAHSHPGMGVFARIYSIHPMNADQADFYEENLYLAEEAERLPCSARAIIYCPTIIGGLIALQVKAHAVGGLPAREILFDLPSLKLATLPAAVHQAVVVA